MENLELQHWGIKGMKWGVRRYQNKDGSLTPAGRKRYSEGGKVGEDSSSSTSPKKKSVSEMSDEELNKAVRRLQLEKQYRDLSPKTVSKGKQFVDKVLNDVIVPAATEAGKQLVRDYLIKAGTSALNKSASKVATTPKVIKKKKQ